MSHEVARFHEMTNKSLKVEAPKRLINPTRRVVVVAMRLIKQGSIDEENAQTVFVKDPQTQQTYRLSDYDIGDHENESDQPHDYPGLNSGLIIELLSEDGSEIDGINLPRLPERITRETLYPIQFMAPRIMKILAKQLERAVPYTPIE